MKHRKSVSLLLAGATTVAMLTAGGVSLTAGRRVLAHPLPPNCKQSLNPLAIFHAKDYDSVSTQKVRVLTLFVYKTV